MNEEKRKISEEGYFLFQERMNLPAGDRDLSPEELKELEKEGLI